MPLGQHLGTDQDVGLAAMYPFGQRLPLLAISGRIAIDTQNARLGIAFGEGGFQPLGASSESLDVLVATGRAGFRHRALRTAMVAAQTSVKQVQYEIGGAARAVRNPSAVRTGKDWCVAATVKEDQALLATRESLFNRQQQGAGQPVLQFFSARIDTLHNRQAGRIRNDEDFPGE